MVHTQNCNAPKQNSLVFTALFLTLTNINLWHICGMKMPQMALRDVKRREAGMQKSQQFQGFSERYEKIRQSMIGPHNPKVVGSNPSSATMMKPTKVYLSFVGFFFVS